MNPSPAAIAAINTYVGGLSGGWAGNTDAQIVTAANTPAIANPTPQGTVPTPFTFATLLGSLSQSSAANVESFPGISDLYNDIIAQNSARVLAAIALMTASGRILSSEATAMTATVNATELDPSWPAQVGWAQVNLGRPLDLSDSATARAIQ
jgi:hypothetical protein